MSIETGPDGEQRWYFGKPTPASLHELETALRDGEFDFGGEWFYGVMYRDLVTKMVLAGRLTGTDSEVARKKACKLTVKHPETAFIATISTFTVFMLRHRGETVLRVAEEVLGAQDLDLAMDLATQVGDRIIELYEWTMSRWGSPVSPAGMLLTPETFGDEAECGGLWFLDSDLANFLETLGQEGRAEAEKVREGARQRWADREKHPAGIAQLWLDPILVTGFELDTFVHVLCRALADRVRRLRDVKVPCVTGGDQFEKLLRAIGPHAVVDRSERALSLVDRRGGIVGTFKPTDDAPTMPADFSRKAEVLSSLSTQSVLRYLVRRGWEQRYQSDVRLYNRIDVPGGFTGLAETLRLRSKAAPAKLREAAEVLRHLHIKTPLGEGGVLSWWENRPAPGRPAHLQFTLSGPLTPGYVNDLRQRGVRVPDNLWLVPVLDFPRFVGNEREWSAQARLQSWAVLELRANASELASAGSVVISPKRWRELADNAEVSSRRLPEVLEAFQAEDGGFLVQPSAEHWTLTPGPALETLRRAGERELEGRERGRVAARRRSERGKGR